MTASLSRRGFLAGLGLTAGGLAIGVHGGRAWKLDEAEAAAPAAALSPNPFVHVALDGTVSIVCARAEMGQGIRSTIPALIADELGADPARVTIVQGIGDVKYGDQNTDGSSSIRRGHLDELRQAGATARAMLVAAAARRWRVNPATLTARDHAVHDARGRSLPFADLVAAAAKLPVPKPADAPLRPYAELKRVNDTLPVVDAPDHVTGRGIYGADVRLPGMLTAVIARPPVLGGKVAKLDDAAARAVLGVRHVVQLPAPTGPFAFQPLGGVAVVAEHTWAAMRGRAALAIEWDDGEHASFDTDAYREELLAAVRKPGTVVRKIGDAYDGFDPDAAPAAGALAASYTIPHLVHAPMEPPAAVARVDAAAKTCEVWACTQNPQSAQQAVAKTLGFEPKDVTVHVTLLGGGFGRKSKPDFIVEAALLAREVGAPVRVQWTRDDELRHGYYHSACAQHLAARWRADGKVERWVHRTAFPSIGSTFAPGVTQGGPGELMQGILDSALDVAAVSGEVGPARNHLRIGWLRSVHNINHGFAIGSFVDELAAATRRDPRAMWLDLIGPARVITPKDAGVDKDPNYGEPVTDHPNDAGRLRTVIERVTDLAQWDAHRQAGRALGLAAHRSFVAYVAVVASVVPHRDGGVKVDEVWISIDAGRIVNRDRVISQMEGAVIFGMSIALHGAISAKQGRVVERSLRDYRLVRMHEAPARIHVDIVESERAPSGVGEPGVPPVAPAVCNAIFALTGKRIRDLPVGRQAG